MKELHYPMLNQEIEDYVADGIKKYKWSDEFLIKELAQRGYGEEEARILIAKVKKERVKNKLFWIFEDEDEEEDEEVEEEKDGFTFHPIKLIIGAVISWFWFYNDINLWLLLSFVIVVIIHELGHVVIGKLFGCMIDEMQIFFLSFVSYKPKHNNSESSWKNIRWSLGILPLGGFTAFKMQEETEENDYSTESTQKSPFFNHKPAWQRLLIYAGGIGFNIATYAIFYQVLSFLPLFTSDSPWWYDVCDYVMIVSLIMAVLNILPVYPLDGGQIIFSIYEMITGKKPASWFITICGIIGLAFIVIFFWIFPEWIMNFIDPVLDIFL